MTGWTVAETDFGAVGRDAWDDLVARSPHATVFQTWGWQHAWWRAFAAWGARDLLLVRVSDDDGLAGLAPFMVERAGTQRLVRFIGDGRGRSGALDIVCAAGARGGEARRLVLAHLRTHAHRWDELHLGPIPEDSPTVGALRAWVAASGFVLSGVERRSVASLLLPADASPGDDAAPEREVDGGGFAVERSRDPAAIARRLNDFYAQHIHRWAARETQSPFVDRASRDFGRTLVEEHGAAGTVFLTTLRSANASVGYHFGLASGRGPLWYEASVDVRASDRLPERALLRDLIGVAREHGLVDALIAPGDAAALPGTATRWSTGVRVLRERRDTVLSPLRRTLAPHPAVRRLRSAIAAIGETADVALHATRIVETRREKSRSDSAQRSFYDTGTIARHYGRTTRLQKPELTILEALRSSLPGMRMLDIGVGAGRTVPFFATLAREYRAIDFAPNMVAACRQFAGDIVDPARIEAGDARDMPTVADASCDFVLFSYNGIDDVGGDADRLRVFAEIRRVAAPGAQFCFSTHNMQSLTWRGAQGVRDVLRRWCRYRLLRAANPRLAELTQEPSAMVFDIGGDFVHPHYYISPSAQVRQLEGLGFTEVRVFSVNTGREVTGVSERAAMIDSWVYYLCRV